jgi:hypothetical protein
LEYKLSESIKKIQSLEKSIHERQNDIHNVQVETREFKNTHSIEYNNIKFNHDEALINLERVNKLLRDRINTNHKVQDEYEHKVNQLEDSKQ